MIINDFRKNIFFSLEYSYYNKHDPYCFEIFNLDSYEINRISFCMRTNNKCFIILKATIACPYNICLMALLACCRFDICPNLKWIWRNVIFISPKYSLTFNYCFCFEIPMYGKRRNWLKDQIGCIGLFLENSMTQYTKSIYLWLIKDRSF